MGYEGGERHSRSLGLGTQGVWDRVSLAPWAGQPKATPPCPHPPPDFQLQLPLPPLWGLEVGDSATPVQITDFTISGTLARHQGPGTPHLI